jgi:hypothetical protein
MVLLLSACSDSKDMAADTTKTVIKFSKQVLGGISEGVDEGRKEAEGIDGAVIVTNIDELEQYVNVELLTVKSVDSDQKTAIEVGFQNRSEKPIRIANLDDKATVLLLDTAGYAQELDGSNRQNAEITIPPKAGKKYSFLFNVPVSKAKNLRLWNKEFEIKNPPVIN